MHHLIVRYLLMKATLSTWWCHWILAISQPIC